MNRDEWNWATGRVIFWDLDEFDPQRSTPEQASVLKEDLLLVAFPNGRTLDVGWYPSFDPQGQFLVAIAKDGNWDYLEFEEAAKSGKELGEVLTRAIHLAASA
jgi:hypothetical protein